jgi:endoplasmic reticulum resident protein 44
LKIIRILQGKELAVLVFGAKRCRHSNYLEHIVNELPQYFDKSKVIILSLDCRSVNFTKYCKDNNISKFPTMKMVYLGIHMKTEYRGQRTVTAIQSYIEKLIDNDIQILDDIDKLVQVRADNNHRCVIGFFSSMKSDIFRTFKKVSGIFHEQCYFYAFINDVQQLPVIAIRDSALGDDIFTGKQDINSIYQWIRDNCRPLVPEMTFNNAEEYIEQKKPLLILYRNTSDLDSINQFTKVVNSEVKDLLETTITALHVDGAAFRNALRFSNLTIEDLPLIQIDTFLTYFTFGNFTNILNSGNLRTFVLNSIDNSKSGTFDKSKKSIFSRLKPSSNRYSFVEDILRKDEL